MSTLKVDGIRSNSATSDAITLADNGTCTANITNNLSNRNLCINGADMLVAQRGTSTTGLQNSGGIYTIDRFSYRRSGTWSNAVFKHEQVNSGSGLFRKALKVTCTTAEGSVPSGTEAVMIGHYLEAQDTIAHFGDGTAEAKSFTVSFYVKASIATTYALQMMTAHLTTDKNFSKTFVVSSANTWERKTLTFPALTDSIGGALDVTSTGTGMMFTWMLDAVTGTVAADTFSNSGSHKLPSGVSTTGFSNTLNATFQLAGVQIEAGTVATDLEHRSFGQELQLCKRYYQQINQESSSTSILTAFGNGSGRLRGLIYLPVEMRANPTVSLDVSGGNPSFYSYTASPPSFASLSGVESTKKNIIVDVNVSSVTAGAPYDWRGSGAFITINAEL